MVEDIRNNRGKFRGFGENAMALAAATHFKNAPCNPLKWGWWLCGNCQDPGI